ncbi:MAG: hypothetical protein ACKV2V_27285 [Blastocatellia bacterium]
MAQLAQVDQGWIISIPDDMVKIMGVARGSVGVLHPKAGGIEVEILPPLDPDLRSSVLEGCEELREAFEELKHIGD